MSDSKMINAMKDGQHRQFTDAVWSRLGKDHGGWEQVSDAVMKQLSKKNGKTAGVVEKPTTPIENKKLTSKDMTVDKATVSLKELSTLDEVTAFSKDDKRKSFMALVEKKIEELTDDVVVEPKVGGPIDAGTPIEAKADGTETVLDNSNGEETPADAEVKE